MDSSICPIGMFIWKVVIKSGVLPNVKYWSVLLIIDKYVQLTRVRHISVLSVRCRQMGEAIIQCL
jgi:hypothetical protein